jgi:heterodisulfide reductase subunit A
MLDAGRHPRIEVLASSTLKSVSGYVGNFTAVVTRKARFVSKACTSCGDCVQVCPVSVPDEFEEGLGTRRAIYKPFPQAVPATFLIDPESCLGQNPVACGKCREVCGPKAIDYEEKDQEIVLEVGTVVVATGAEPWDPTPNVEYGYGRHLDVLTSVEFERMLSAGGPTGGHVVRPSDGKEPKRIAFVQCVGSRTQDATRGVPYCSNFCCMETVKTTLQVQEHVKDAAQTVYYMDIRAFGKGFEGLYSRSRAQGVRYVHAIPSMVRRGEDGTLFCRVVDPDSGAVVEEPQDLVVLAVGVKPRVDSGAIQQCFTLSRTEDGFFLESHPKLKPVDTPTGGVFLAGFVESPKDIKDSVTQASAAASRAGILMNQGEVTVEAITSRIDDSLCTACGQCAKVCPFHAITVDKAKGSASVVDALCQGCGTCGPECRFDAITLRHFTDEQYFRQIDAALEEGPEDKVLAFCCNWCSYAGADFAGVSRMQHPGNVRIVRSMCSGRIDERFVLYALEKRAGIVLVSGCHIGDCHYIDANRNTLARVEKWQEKMRAAGLDAGRLVRKWVSAAEGRRWADTIEELVKRLPSVTREDVEKAAAWARDARLRNEARLGKHREKRRASAPEPAAAAAGGGA